MTAGQSPPSAEGETETPEEKSWPKGRRLMAFHCLRGLWAARPGSGETHSGTHGRPG